MTVDVTTLPKLRSLRKHPLYYNNGGDLIVIVGDDSFRVPSIFFTRESKDFDDRLSGGDARTGGATNKDNDVCYPRTIIIHPDENVTADDFAQLCWVFFNPKFGQHENTLEGWKTILRLANQWHFAEVKDLAFRKINSPKDFPMSLVDRIVLYQEYEAEFEPYLEPLYIELLSRPHSLSIDEGRALGLETALTIAAARQDLRSTLLQPLSASDHLPIHMEDAVRQTVRTMFCYSTTTPSPPGKPATETRSPAPSTKPQSSVLNGDTTRPTVPPIPDPNTTPRKSKKDKKKDPSISPDFGTL